MNRARASVPASAAKTSGTVVRRGVVGHKAFFPEILGELGWQPRGRAHGLIEPKSLYRAPEACQANRPQRTRLPAVKYLGSLAIGTTRVGGRGPSLWAQPIGPYNAAVAPPGHGPGGMSNRFAIQGEFRMVLTPSTMLPLGTKAPPFSLLNVDGRTVSLADFAGAKALLVVFMCNHCPYVKHVAPGLAELAREYQAQRRGGRRHQLQRHVGPSGRLARANGAGSRRTGATRSPICSTKRRKLPGPIAPPARPTFTCSTKTSGWSIVDKWMPAGRATACR